MMYFFRLCVNVYVKMDDLSDMNLDKFKLWSIHALKVFLSKRKADVDGSFDELCARAFCAWEQQLPVDAKAECREMRLLDEYNSKLRVDGGVLPDPMMLKSGWKGENAGMNLWPSIYITDISAYIDGTSPSAVVHKLMNEYKLGKAYRYFDNEWVREVLVHQISEECDKCFLKAKVKPSQRVNNASYNVWVCVKKDQSEKPGGEIMSAYCTCTAGMYGTCNHIAGLLFRCEHAVKTGATKIACTSKSATWVVPKGKQLLNSAKAKDVAWKKSHYLKSPTDRHSELMARKMKQAFTPLTKKQSEDVKDGAKMRLDLHTLLAPDIPDSCFSLTMEGRRHKKKSIELPKTIIELSKETLTANELISKLTLTDTEIENLKIETVNQSESLIWHAQRRGRITASIFKRVCTRVDTIRKDQTTDVTKLKEAILGEKPLIQTKAMKHGIAMEPAAKREYISTQKKTHRKFKATNTGLAVDKDKSFLAASSDMETFCMCCGSGLCEIKCPESIKEQTPTPTNVPFIIEQDDTLSVDPKHSYYYQIQGQMAICQKAFCDFFVFTLHGHILIRVFFDEEFWETVKDKLCWFWFEHILPSFFEKDENDNVTVPNKPVRRMLIPVEDVEIKQTNLHSEKVKKVRKSIMPKKKVFHCGVCRKECLDFPERSQDHSVCCDGCDTWVHYDCAGVTEETVKSIDVWMCAKCLK